MRNHDEDNDRSQSQPSGYAAVPSLFDRIMGQIDGLPDVIRTEPSQKRIIPPLGIGGAQMWVIQSFRQKGEGDTIFLENVSENGTIRLVIPPAVSELIARQRDALTTKSRRKAAKASAADRKARGIQPAFLKPGGPHPTTPYRKYRKGGSSR